MVVSVLSPYRAAVWNSLGPICRLQTMLVTSAHSPGIVVSHFGQASPEVGMPVLQNFSDRDFNSGGEQFWTIGQDHRGLMYFGRSGGILLEYDEVTWRKIFAAGSVVRAIAVDDAGKIWIGG